MERWWTGRSLPVTARPTNHKTCIRHLTRGKKLHPVALHEPVVVYRAAFPVCFFTEPPDRHGRFRVHSTREPAIL
ncbi:MAG TPA: hypothetical protein DHV36_16300 [Desulfobacteraceae bacterium]|nr:hypothetical protein [Desulfobacteraceae bacterium]